MNAVGIPLERLDHGDFESDTIPCPPPDVDDRTMASAGCYGCLGTGVMQGFGMQGGKCACVATCFDCDEPFAWERDDERAPRLCPGCR